MDTIGLYIHVPFCNGKCPYCDFYSLFGSETVKRTYEGAMFLAMRQWAGKLRRRADTLYFGGGTPQLLGAERLCRLIGQARELFWMQKDAEITCEVNPSDDLAPLMQRLAEAGVNRISIGMQSANEEELKLLGRRHSAGQAGRAVEAARRAGIQDISLDVMLCLPGQTVQKLQKTLEYCIRLGIEHVSAYMLKVEPGTPYARMGEALQLPEEEEQCALYLALCEYLERHGYRQYEISNFAKPGRECRHNLKYWNCEEYLGLGPGAHSFCGGKRFYYPRDLSAFCAGSQPLDDGEGGGLEEYAMLRLRLNDGLNLAQTARRFGACAVQRMADKAIPLEQAGLLTCHHQRVALTRKGFLVSNLVIGELLS